MDSNVIIAVSAIFTVILLIANICQAIAVKKGVDVLKDGGRNKTIAIVLMIAFVILFIAHLATALQGSYSGPKLSATGGIAFIFAIIAAVSAMFPDKFGDKRTMLYFGSLIILWILIIAHIVLRFV